MSQNSKAVAVEMKQTMLVGLMVAGSCLAAAELAAEHRPAVARVDSWTTRVWTTALDLVQAWSLTNLTMGLARARHHFSVVLVKEPGLQILRREQVLRPTQPTKQDTHHPSWPAHFNGKRGVRELCVKPGCKPSQPNGRG